MWIKNELCIAAISPIATPSILCIVSARYLASQDDYFQLIVHIILQKSTIITWIQRAWYYVLQQHENTAHQT